MANSTKGSGNFLIPLAIVGAVVVALLVGVFAMTGEEPPEEATVISEDINAEPTGAGTAPEGEADMAEQGIEEEPGEQAPAGGVTNGTDGSGAGQQAAQTSSTGGATAGSDEGGRVQPTGEVTTEATQAGGADGEQDSTQSDAATLVEDQSATEEFLIDEETASDGGDEAVDTQSENETSTAAALPEGRDAQTNLTPEECQDIVQDTDNGGAAVIPTPSGPNGNTGDCVQSAQ